MRPHPLLVVVAVGALVGLVFATVSTYDFMGHLDRQVHGIHCSFLPGLVGPDASTASGCHTALMSPYSSVFRDKLWGGIPVSLPGVSVFAFLLFVAVFLATTDRQDDPRATGFLTLATLVPLGTSLVMGYLALFELEAACKLCIGIYFASLVVALGAFGLWWRARGRAQRQRRRATGGEDSAPRREPLGSPLLAAGVALGGAFVLVPLVTYAMVAPSFERYVGTCGTLPHPQDPHQVLIPLDSSLQGLEAIEVLDPLCPSCRSFEERLSSSGLGSRLRRKVVLMPLDNTCNWMVDSAVHPGACTVSEAVLCAGPNAQEVLDWAFSQQERLRALAQQNPDQVSQLLLQTFPALRGCLGSAGVRARLNRTLRWAVANQLPILAPQLYVAGMKLCDEDTDLGLDFMLTHLVERAQASPPVPPEPADLTSSGPADSASPLPRPRGLRSAGSDNRSRSVERPSEARPGTADSPGPEPTPALPAGSSPEPAPGPSPAASDALSPPAAPAQPAAPTVGQLPSVRPSATGEVGADGEGEDGEEPAQP